MEERNLSFLYGGKPFADCFDLVSDEMNGDIETRVWRSGSVTVTNIKTFYPDFDAYEWVNYFENTGAENSQIISSLWDCDHFVEFEPEEKRTPCAWLKDVKDTIHINAPGGSDLHGSEFFCDTESYRDLHYVNQLLGGDIKRYSTIGGRSCDGHAPFFNIHKKGKGVIFAVGWTGQWHSEIECVENGIVFRSGLEDGQFYLEPGEKIRTSSVTVMHYECDEISSQNKWRRLVRKHFSLIGKPGRETEGTISANLWGGMTTDECLRRLDKIDEYKINVDHIWMDAGWYGESDSFSPDEFEGDWFSHTGDWRVNPHTHPDGLRMVADRIHRSGKKFILWFEPERVRTTTPIYKEHPEYLLANPDNPENMLLNLGDEKAWNYCFETLCGIIEALKVDYYREDFNFQPLYYWRYADKENRKGMTEIKYINGLYKLWDALLEKFPTLMIDNCASGGRRIDIETLRRSVPLWHSDSQCPSNAPAEVCQQQLINYALWMPYFGSSSGRLYDTYYARGNMYPCMANNHSFSQKTPFGDNEKEMLWLKDTVEEARLIRPYFEGDIYPLTRPGEAKDTWSAYQLNCPEKANGLLMLFRRDDSPYETCRFNLRGLENNTCYTFMDKDTKESFNLTARELKDGVVITMPKTHSSKIILYKKA